MNRKFRFKKGYFILAVVLFIIEVLIALYIKDEIIRPHIGDVIVVMLIYCFLKAFLNVPVITLAVTTLLFAYLIELLQYYNIVARLGLENFTLARIVIGTYFSWVDMLCYTLGIIIVLFVEKLRPHKNRAEVKPG